MSKIQERRPRQGEGETRLEARYQHGDCQWYSDWHLCLCSEALLISDWKWTHIYWGLFGSVEGWECGISNVLH